MEYFILVRHHIQYKEDQSVFNSFACVHALQVHFKFGILSFSSNFML